MYFSSYFFKKENKNNEVEVIDSNVLSFISDK